MKKAKSILSVLLCATILLSCAPVFNLNLFSTQASAASYTKKHEKEYYFPLELLLFRILLQVMERKQLMLKDP